MRIPILALLLAAGAVTTPVQAQLAPQKSITEKIEWTWTDRPETPAPALPNVLRLSRAWICLRPVPIHAGHELPLLVLWLSPCVPASLKRLILARDYQPDVHRLFLSDTA